MALNHRRWRPHAATTLLIAIAIALGAGSCKRETPGATELQLAWQHVRTQPEEARKLCAKARELGAPAKDVDRILAAVHEQLEEYDEAAKLTAGILAASPEDLDARLTLARLKIRSGSPDEARVQLHKTLSHKPLHVPSLLVFLAMARDAGEIADGRGALKTFDQPHFASLRGSAEFAAAEAGLRFAEGRRKEALAKLEEANDAKSLNPLLGMALANTYAAVGREELAEWLLIRASAAPNSTPPVHLRLAQIALSLRHLSTAEEAIARLHTEYKPTAEALMLLATLHELRDDPQESVQVLRRARTAAGADSPQTKLNVDMRLAGALMRSGGAPQAVEILRELLKKHPGYPPAVFALAKHQIAHGAASDALAALGPLTQTAETRDEASRLVVRAHRANGDVEAAEQAARKYFESSDRSTPSVTLLSQVLVDSGRKGNALELARTQLASRPADATLASLELELTRDVEGPNAADARAEKLATRQETSMRRLAAGHYMRRENFPQAVAVLSTLVDEEPELLSDLATAQDRAGDLPAAIGSMRKRVEKAPSDQHALLKLGMLLERSGGLEDAKQAYERALRIDAKSPIALNNLAALYTGPMKRPADAVAVARQAAAAAPKNPAVMDTLGWALIVANAPQTAHEAVRLLRESAPRLGTAEAHYHLAVALSRVDDVAESLQILERLEKVQGPFPQRAEAEALATRLRASSK